MALPLSISSPANAHQPVFLANEAAKITKSPVLVDGLISFAVTANFDKAAQTRHFRFALRAGEPLKLEYLILDRKPENQLRTTQLPTVTITSPNGKKFSMKINERTKFYEPFGKQNYFFLSRLNQNGEAGIYTISIKSRAKSSALVAVGSKEIRGEVMEIGSGKKSCPEKLKVEEEISEKRAQQLIGLSERASELCAEINEWGYRVVQRDGEDFAVTLDYRSNRVNVKIKDDEVIEATVG